MIRRVATPQPPAVDRPPVDTETLDVHDFEFTFIGPVIFTLTVEEQDLVEVTPRELVFTIAKTAEEVRINRHQLLYRSDRRRTVTRPKPLASTGVK